MSMVKKSSDDDLKLVSYDQKSKRSVNVLDEDTYIKKLDSIIEKSFFPDLERLKIQQAYQEALKANNYDALNDLYERYNKHVASSEPKVNSTPRKSDGSATDLPYANEEPPVIDLEQPANGKITESLDTFLANNTSEDNISFEALIEDAEKKQRTKIHQAWLFEKEKQHLKKSEESLMLDGPKHNDDLIKSLDSWRYTSKNTLMYIPEGAPLTLEEELVQAKSSRVINHSNTRFTPEELNRLGTVVQMPASSTKTNLLATSISKLNVEGKEASAKETPKIRGYSLVDPCPSPMPGNLAGDESPMMVWGEVESTPMRLDPTQTPYTPRMSDGPEFKIPDIPEREKIALQLEEKISAEKRKKKIEALKQVQRSIASPSRNVLSSPRAGDRINNMSPAAQRLLSLKKKSDSILSSPILGRSPSIK
ncbi:DGCR14 -like protein, partial [Brachionus plicatilis]